MTSFLRSEVPTKRVFPKNVFWKGFSFLEVIISLFILSVGLLGALSLWLDALKNSNRNRDAIVATMLAQEGIELVRNIRDTNILNGRQTFHGFPSGSRNCRIDMPSSPDSSPNLNCGNGNGNGGRMLSKDPSGFFVHGDHLGTVSTGFSREVRLLEGSSSYEVQSQVAWDNADFPSDPDNCTPENKCILVRSILEKDSF